MTPSFKVAPAVAGRKSRGGVAWTIKAARGRRSITLGVVLHVVLILCAGCQTAFQGEPARHPNLVSAQLPEVVPAWDLLRTQFARRFHHKLSPDGTKLAWTALESRSGFRVAYVQPVAGGPIAVIAGSSVPIIDYYWAADSRHLLLTKDVDGSENEHILSADIEQPGKPFIDLTPVAGSKNILDDIPPCKPETVYIRGNERKPTTFDLYAIDVATGQKTMVAENDGTIGSWLFDDAGGLRGRFRKSRFELYDVASGTWRETFVLDGSVKLLTAPDDKGLVWAASSRRRDKVVLVRLNLNNGAEEVVFGDSAADLAEIVIDRQKQVPITAATWRGYQMLHVFDAGLAKSLARLQKDERDNVSIVSADRSFTKLVVEVADEQGAEDVYFLDREAGTSRLLVHNEGVAWRGRISLTEPVSFKSSDGMTIHGFLTIPKGTRPQGLPMVVLVHGGPWSADRWGFDDGVQFLANRGYAVLRINFRGSTGYGRTFMFAAAHEFAGKMHQDLVDGVQWAIERGIADPQHIAIMGTSYGGYAAMVGLTVTPYLFAAAIEMNGMSDIAALSDHLPPYWPPDIWRAFVGDPGNPADRKEMAEKSPLFHVDRIARPLLAVQSANDVRVKQDQFDRLVRAMRASGKAIETVEFPNEGHTPREAKDYYEFFRASERFLAKYLGGRTGP